MSYLLRIISFVLIICSLNLPFKKSLALSAIRDSETESFLRDIATPLWKKSGLNPDSVRIILINNPQLNAYVTGGQMIFLHTGIITQFENPFVLLGVLAHETGHISGGHLARGHEVMDKAFATTALTYVLGAAAAVSGSPDAALALLQGGNSLAQHVLLSHSRENERAADNHAVRLLEQTGYSASGLLELLEWLSKEEQAFQKIISPYALTHPLSSARVDAIRQSMTQSATLKTKFTPPLQEVWQRVRLKLIAFTHPIDHVGSLLNHLPSDSIAAQYARSIWLYRQSRISEALEIANQLINKEPNNPFFYEWAGQILIETGKATEALRYYQQALKLRPKDSLFQLSMGMIYLAQEELSQTEKALPYLRTTHQQEPFNIVAIEQLIVAYGRLGNMAMTYYHQAEKAFLMGDKEQATRYINQAKETGSPNKKLALKLGDLEKSVMRMKDKTQ
jgi:predicted Zn-dependent protease